MGNRRRQGKLRDDKRVRAIRAVMAVFAAGLMLGLGIISAVAATVEVDCDKGGKIGESLGSLQPGDTLAVSGTCRESVYIPRQARKITLDGRGKTTIQGPDTAVAPTGPSAFVFFIEGTDITIRDFAILGGFHGIHLSGPASTVIEGNTIRKTGGGVHLDKGSIAWIINNAIEDNLGMGIHLQENSYARIGFIVPPRPAPMPNVIRNNAGHGIAIDRRSSAWIVGNRITDNKGHGVQVDRNSQADVAGNTIEGNTGDGIHARFNSGVNLSSEGSERSDGPNLTKEESKNAGFGIHCEVDGYVAGPQGSLTGAQGSKHFDDSCTDRVTSK